MADSALYGRILVLGAGGQLGRALCRELGAAAIGLRHADLDITRADDVRRAVGAIAPTAVVNAAAYTQVDRAEDQPQHCYAVNAEGVRNVAAACMTSEALLVQISTDYIFGGDRQRATPFAEHDRPAPVNVYGRSKLAGEEFASECPRHVIVRTSGLYGGDAPAAHFVGTMLRWGAECRAGRRRGVRVVADQTCSPTHVVDLARAIAYLIELSATGVYHVTSRGATTWFEFAQAIFRATGVNVLVEAITTEQFAARADRPRYSVLDTSRYHALGGPAMPTWDAALAAFLSTRPSWTAGRAPWE